MAKDVTYKCRGCGDEFGFAKELMSHKINNCIDWWDKVRIIKNGN